MRVGYARVSTAEQRESLAAQTAALTAAGCSRVFEDIASGAKANRAGLAAAIDYVRAGDELMVTRLDRLGRTTVDTLKTVRDLDAHGVRIKAQDLDLDTGTPAGRLVVSVLASLAEWERDTLRERVKDGLAHAHSQGRVGGRPKALRGDARTAALAALASGMSVAAVAQLHGVSRWTIARARDEQGRSPVVQDHGASEPCSNS